MYYKDYQRDFLNNNEKIIPFFVADSQLAHAQKILYNQKLVAFLDCNNKKTYIFTCMQFNLFCIIEFLMLVDFQKILLGNERLINMGVDFLQFHV